MQTQPSKFIILLIAGALVLALAGCQQAAQVAQAAQAVQVGQVVQAAQAGQAASTADATPTALPTRAVVASNSLAIDGQITLAGPLVTAAFESSGQVTAVNVTAGQAVKKGDLLAQIDATALRTAVKQAEAALALKEAQVANSLAPAKQTDIDSAKASLSSAYAAYAEVKKGPDAHTVEQALVSWDEAKNSLYSVQLTRDTTCGFTGSYTPLDVVKKAKMEPKCKRADLAVQSGERSVETAHQAYLDAQQPATQDALTQAWASVVQAQSSLATLQNGVSDAQKKVYEVELAQARVTVNRAQRDLEQAKLLSPCDCVVQEVTLVPGSLSSSGSITLLDTAQLTFQTTNLNERDVVKLQAGQKAVIRLKAFEQTFTGKVGPVLPESSATSGSVALYTAIIELDATQVATTDATKVATTVATTVALLPGMTGQVDISLK